MPVNPNSLRPSKLWIIAAQRREEEFAKRNKSLISQYNQSTRTLPILENGTNVSIQDSDHDGRWRRFGVIVDRCDRKCIIQVHGSGRIISRNRRFIKPVLNNHDNDTQLTTDYPIVSDDVYPSKTSSSDQPTNLQAHQSDDESRLPVPGGEPTSSDTSNVRNTVDVSNDLPTEDSQSSSRAVPIPRMLKELEPFNRPGLKE